MSARRQLHGSRHWSGRDAGGSDGPPRLSTTAGGRLIGVVAALAVIALVVLADLLEGPMTAYVGVLVAAPLLAAVFARPSDVVAVGVAALAAGQAYAASVGSASAHPQLVRLGFIAAATVLAAVAARLREVRERQLQELSDVAEAAQAAILRPVPQTAGSLSFAARYRSAATAAHVGGDFYDVASTVHGVRLVIGDVRGKGLDAVRLAATVLGSFREAAHSAGPDLAAVARAVSDSAAREVDVEDFVTAVFVELDLHGRGRMVRCGHPVPLRLSGSGVCEVDTTVDQPPLGLLVEPVAEPLVLAPGERLLLFTDGLSEARDPHGVFLDVERAADGLPGPGLDAALDGLLATVDAHTGGSLQDDLALLLVEHSLRSAPLEVSELSRRSDPAVRA